MSDEIDDGEFWLPSQFLTEEDIITDFNSDLGSPVESVAETESDEDEFLAELTRRMTRSSFLHDSGAPTPKGFVLSRSPQSTLCPVGGGSSRGSPSGPVSPPPALAKEGYFMANDAASFDLLHAAAGEVAKLRMTTEQQQQKGTGYFDSSSRGFLYPPKTQITPVSLSSDFHGFFSHQQRFQFPQLSEEFFHGGRSNNHLSLSSSAFPPLQRPQNRQPHAPPPQNLPVSFIAPVSKRESVGTGVFLPRTVNNAPTEPRKIRNNKPDSTGRFRGHSNGFHGPRRNSENARAVSVSNSEIQLPSEWTY